MSSLEHLELGIFSKRAWVAEPKKGIKGLAALSDVNDKPILDLPITARFGRLIDSNRGSNDEDARERKSLKIRKSTLSEERKMISAFA